LRPKDFTLEKLDEELQCMAIIRALPEDYKHLSASLLLMPSLDKETILQAFRSEELNRHRQVENLNQALGQRKPFKRTGKCYKCGKEGHWSNRCRDNNDKQAYNTEGAKKTEEKVAVTEFAGKASAVSEHEANSTSSNVFHWNTDTGATSSMTPHRHWIRNYTPYRVPIRLADHRIIYSKGVGTVRFRPSSINGKQNRDVEFTRVLHVPALCNNLLSVLYLTKFKDIDVYISSDKMHFMDPDQNVLFRASIGSDNIGYLDGTTIDAKIDITESVQLVSAIPLNLSLWHKRLGHQNYDDIKLMISKDMVVGLKLDSNEKPDPICEPCLAGKMHANPFPSTENRATEVLELVHSDVHQVGVRSHSGFNYWVTFIDDCGRYKAVMPMRNKSDTFSCFKTYKAWAENLTGKKIKRFRENKGGEYMSNEFNAFLETHGIAREHSCRNRC
jgi:hypothetical protein